MLAEDTPEELSISDFEVEADPAPAPVEEGERKFGRYRLKYQIASGGMASIFLAGAAGVAGFEKPVAIKRMHPHLARRKAYVDMFLDEARITSQINHPNVCQVFDFGETNGAYYMALEYLVGEPLTTILAQVQKDGSFRSAPWRAIAARICVAICEGLHAAHELRDSEGHRLDVVHRDVSPSNVIVTFDGGVKVVDFGVAKARGQLHQTTTGTLKGKFSYMAPEQVAGQGVDARSDIWSVGVCLWEMLTCKRLFRRPSEMETLTAVGRGAIADPSELVPGVPPELAAIALRALNRNPDRRYATARDMARDLDRWIQKQSEPAGMADVADFLSGKLTREHDSKELFVRTAMINGRDAESGRGGQAVTRLITREGGGGAGTRTPTQTSLPGARAEAQTTLREASTTEPQRNTPLLVAIMAALLVTLLAVIASVMIAIGHESSTATVPNAPKRITPRRAEALGNSSPQPAEEAAVPLSEEEVERRVAEALRLDRERRHAERERRDTERGEREAEALRRVAEERGQGATAGGPGAGAATNLEVR